MKDIICPKCGTVFQVDESDYAAIVEQVRTTLFKQELDRRVVELNEQLLAKEEAIRLTAEKNYTSQLSVKDKEINNLSSEITGLKARLSNYEALKKSELTELRSQSRQELTEAIALKDRHIAELEAKISGQSTVHRLEISELKNSAVAQVQQCEQEIVKLRAEIESGKLVARNRESQLREQHKLQLEDKQAEIEHLRNFKLRQSTKMVGESLEQHCFAQFATAQSLGAFASAVLEKDNAVVDHSKGDFVFRDYVDGSEYVSIMFEMKNEVDTTATKHRNDDFLEKLDRDRRNKNCEYAVLVSMLEMDNPVYEGGIVDVSHRYPKMIVIRPQFFLPVLRLISESSRKGFAERRALMQQLETARSQSVDFANFESKISKFRINFSKNVAAAHKKFEDATNGIDKTIEALEKQIKALRDIKANFEASEQKLLKANEMAEEDLTIRKLTHGNPNIRRMIQEAASDDEKK